MLTVTLIQFKLNSISIQIHKADLIKKNQASLSWTEWMCSKSFELYSNTHKYCSGPEEKFDKTLIYKQRKNLFPAVLYTVEYVYNFLATIHSVFTLKQHI